MLAPALGILNAMPIYRSEWSGMGTTSRRFTTCNSQIRGVPLTPQQMHSGWNWYHWMVPSAALRTGMNSLVLQVAQPTRVCYVLVARAAPPTP